MHRNFCLCVYVKVQVHLTLIFAANAKMVHVLWLTNTLFDLITVELIVAMKFDHLLIYPAKVTLKNQFIFTFKSKISLEQSEKNLHKFSSQI